MNSTNRTLNRVLLIVIGTLLLACGLAAVAVTTAPGRDRLRSSTVLSLRGAVVHAWQVGDAFAGDPSVPWLLLAAPVGALILIVLLLVFIFRQGRGHTARAVEVLKLSGTSTPGTLTVDVSFAADVIQRALVNRGEIAAISVTAYRVKRKPALKVTVTPRRGAAPTLVLAAVEDAATACDSVLGVRVPIFIHLNRGVRTALSRAARAV